MWGAIFVKKKKASVLIQSQKSAAWMWPSIQARQTLVVPPCHRRGLSLREHECVCDQSHVDQSWCQGSSGSDSPSLCLSPLLVSLPFLSRSHHPSLSSPSLWLWDSGNATPEHSSLRRIINACWAGGPMPPPDFSKQVLSVEPACSASLRQTKLTDWFADCHSLQLSLFTSWLSLPLYLSALSFSPSLSPSHTHTHLRTHTRHMHTLVLYTR